MIKLTSFSCVSKQKYAPSVFEKYVTTISLGGKEIKLNLYDTAGETLYQKSPPFLNMINFLLIVHFILCEETTLGIGAGSRLTSHIPTQTARGNIYL